MNILLALVLALLSLASPSFAAHCTVTSTGLLPSPYVRSAETLAAGLAAAALVEPLDANGVPSPTGKIGFINIGYSNASMISEGFRALLIQDRSRHPSLVYATGSVSGKTARNWANPNDSVWTTSAQQIAYRGLTPPQVQWVHSDFHDLWNDGEIPNPVTGMTWHCGDQVTDGVHPSTAGVYRHALFMLDRWRADPVMSWMWKP